MEAAQLTSLSPVPVALRPACPEDLETVVTLLSHLGYSWSCSELSDLYGRILEDPALTVFLAVHGGNVVVGLMTLRVFPVLRLNGDQVSVEELVVHRDYQGRGIGSRLLQFARQFTMKREAVRLEVLTSKTRECFKRGFYEKHGLHPAPSAVYRLHF
jgi:GNAT superfamily N-acetyltransferase